MMTPSELQDAQAWIHSRNGVIRRVPGGSDGAVKVIVSVGSLSRQSSLQSEQPGDYDALVVTLVAELKAALADIRLRPCR